MKMVQPFLLEKEMSSCCRMICRKPRLTAEQYLVLACRQDKIVKMPEMIQLMLSLFCC